MSIGASTIIEAMAIAIVASLLASVYPSWKMSKISPAEALRRNKMRNIKIKIDLYPAYFSSDGFPFFSGCSNEINSGGRK